MTRVVRSLWLRLRSDSGNAVAEFPLVSAMVVMVALSVIQLALFVHVRNGLTDAAVQASYFAALQGNDVDDGVERAHTIAERRFASLVDPRVTAAEHDGIIRIEIRADLPLVGFLGPSNALVVSGHAVKEESL